MTANVTKVLEKIKNHSIFESNLYFIGGTALSYYIDHRISEDIDIVSANHLKYKDIIPSFLSLGAVRIQDENISALRMAGLFPEEYMIKFILDDVKLEFFQANRVIQKEILQEATFQSYENSSLKILDVKSISKLKLVALFHREKSRDLFDFGAIIQHKVLNLDEILEIANKTKNIKSIDELYKYISSKTEPIDDEAVYISENHKINLPFETIKKDVLILLNTL